VLLSNNGSSRKRWKTPSGARTPIFGSRLLLGPMVPVPQTLSPSQKLASVPTRSTRSLRVWWPRPTRPASRPRRSTEPRRSPCRRNAADPAFGPAAGGYSCGCKRSDFVPQRERAARLELRVNSGTGATVCRQVDRFVSAVTRRTHTIRCVIPNAEAEKTYTFTLFITKLTAT